MSLCDTCPEPRDYRGSCSPRIGLRIVQDKGKAVECNWYDYIRGSASTVREKE